MPAVEVGRRKTETSHPGQSRLASGLAILGLLVFLLLTFAILADTRLTDFDRLALEWLIRYRQEAPAWLTSTARIFTTLGSPGMIAIIAVLSLFWMITRRYRQLALLLTSVIGAEILWLALIFIIGRERPEPVVAFSFLRIGLPGFPSGHAIIAAVFYSLLVYLSYPHIQSRGWRAALIATAAILSTLAGLSRFYLKAHYPSDLIAGYALGLGWAITAFQLVDWYLTRRRKMGD